MGTSRLEAFSDGVAQLIYVAVAALWLVPDRRIEGYLRGMFAVYAVVNCFF